MWKQLLGTVIIVAVGLIVFSAIMPMSSLDALAAPDQQLRRAADFYYDVAVGEVRAHSSVRKFGQNSDVDSAAVEDIWDGGGVWNEPSASQVYTITSTSANDAAAGTGARTIQMYGLDANGALQNETLTLNGVSWVTPTNSYQMVHRLIVRTAGSGGVNAGTITANANTDSNVTAQITVGTNQTLMAVYKVPAATKGCIVSYYGSANKATGATAIVNIILKAKPTGEVWQTKEVLGVVAAGSSNIVRPYGVPNCFEPLTLIKISADTNVDNVDISAGFDMVEGPG